MLRSLLLLSVLCVVLINLHGVNCNPAERSRAFRPSARRSANKSSTKKSCPVNATHTFQELETPKGKELELVHLVFRHGERTPADTYPNDPYINHTFTPYGWGQVTNPGKCRLYDTGKWLKKRYGNFLGPSYEAGLVHAQATGVDRTHITMATVLSGLFPPKNTKQEWNTNLNWQPIPIYSQALDEDNLLLVRINCPRYYEALEEVLKTTEVSEKIRESEEMLKELTKLTGMEIKTAEDVGSLWSTLRAEEAYGLELPEWTKDYYPKKMQELTDLSYIWNVYTPELKRIKGGPFIKKMANEWKDKRDNKLSSKRKLFMYTGHDSTVVNILGALDLWKQQFPEYAIMAIFELYKDTETNEYEVKIYQKNEGQDPIPLKLPGCDETCPLDKVLKHIEPLITTPTLSKECAPHDAGFTTPPPTGP